MKIRTALQQAIRESDLSFGDKMKLRFIMMFHGKEIDKIAEESLAEAGLSSPTNDSFGAPDWAAILKFFIENILPILLKLSA